ncbi:MAG: peptide ABC transporter substrate-binding protein [Pyrinomonadaceae bacterium]
MRSYRLQKIRVLTIAVIAAAIAASCSVSSKGKYFGTTKAPKDNVLRYVSGSEPETLDPQISSGQPEARIYAALYEGLVEYGPKDLQPIPALAKSWETGPNVDEFIFHLRDNAKWSDGKPITADDFVYSFRRAFSPNTISSSTELGFFIQYAEAFKTGEVFVKKGDTYLLAKDFGGPEPRADAGFGPETEFGNFLHSPLRLTISGDEKERAKAVDGDPKLKAALVGAEFVPVKAEDIGIEAIDKYTVRLRLRQPAPFFIGLLAHQFFRLVPQQAVEKWGADWTRREHIVTCGPFRIKEIRPYDALIVERDPNYWDAANVHLDGIEFYPLEENFTILNLYKSGAIDAFLNHTVVTSWIDEVKGYKAEYMNFPEAATAYYSMNVTKPPFDNIKIRKAFALAADRVALSNFRKVTKPLYGITPDGIFPEYDKARDKVSEEVRLERGFSPEVWARYNKFDAEEARKTLTEAGFPVKKNGDSYSCPTFPTDTVALIFNTNENNRAIAEFVQAQWKENLGVTVPLKSQEFKTFLRDRHDVQYTGFAQSLWSGDYMDPYTFLGLHYGYPNNGDSGFNDPKYNKMLDDANAELDPQKRYEMLARAEFYLMEQIPSVTLTINATNWMKKPYVKGMYPNPGTLFPWKFVYIERDPAKWETNVENIMTDIDSQVQSQLEELTRTQKAGAETK